MNVSAKQEYLDKDSERKAYERSQESEESTKLRQLVKATRNLEAREAESEEEHKSRISKQNERQNLLRLKQTPEERKASQVANVSAKVLNIASKAAAFENTYTPNQDWNTKLDKDLLRQEKSRSLETDKAKAVRREKDKLYQRNKRAGLSGQEKNKIKQGRIKYIHDKRVHEKEINSEKWSELHKQKNLEVLRKYGSYVRFLLFGNARTHFYGQYLPQTSDVKDWKLLVNKASNDIMMGSQFFALSKKLAFMFKNIGLVKDDVVHFVIGNHNHNIAILGGVWMIGGICSFSDLTTDIKVIEHQVSKVFLGAISIFMGWGATGLGCNNHHRLRCIYN
jgi:hypothetical protein